MSLKIERRPEPSELMRWLSPVLAIAGTLIVSAIFFALLGKSPQAVFYNFFVAPVQDIYGVTELAVKVAPLLMCAAGLVICYKANIWNIGAEGQFVFGGLIGGWVGLQFLETSSYWAIVPVMLSGMLAGACWAGIAALLKVHFNTNEILTTIMLNYVALNLLQYAVHGPLRDPAGFNFPESAMLSSMTAMPVIWPNTRVHLGIVIALLCCLLIWVVLSRLHLGFRIRVRGADEHAARFAGFSARSLTWVCLLASGGLAGLAGVIEVTGPIGQLIPTISPGYGYAAIIVAFLGRLNPVGIILSSIMMGLIYLGGELAQMNLNLPIAVTSLFQGLLLFFILASDLLVSHRLVWDSAKGATVRGS
ncbi:ABC transporter permease [Gynuella sunshinyii]|uniref:ABC-type uncharacterized transport system, permease component n=1 Tax=Gynuella sunshinyii YC6258 TaxID=1445510 RepID=A0A0C5VRG6_9GAMM|nr:ABC transporter permease [Gynuella sunshinyii]AJQ96836.1 ABC-type uncharacterized transport system, permease component [Gynuella sunshinyii YC6258]